MASISFVNSRGNRIAFLHHVPKSSPKAVLVLVHGFGMHAKLVR